MNKALLIGAITPFVASCSMATTGGPGDVGAAGTTGKTSDRATASYIVGEPQSYPTPPTRILDEEAARRLLGAKGATLQWIDWNRRGSVNARMDEGVLRLTAVQSASDGRGRLYLDGYVSEIGTGYFTFEGVIQITDTPDIGRQCSADKAWHFAVTQNRPYWRLREFEWCDGLTDYVDIYW